MSYRWLGVDKIIYLLSQLKSKFYDKTEIDEKLTHSANAYYYTAAEWARNDIILDGGEIGIDATNGFMKIGNGTSKWSELDYAIFPVSLSQRSDNLLLKDYGDNLFLSEANTRALILEVINQYHSDDTSLKEFITDDGYSLITADGYMFLQK